VSPVVIRRERVVQIPPDVLWQFVEPAQTLPAWFPLAARCELLGGTGLGRRQRMHTRWGRKDASIDQEVISYEPARLLRWKHVDERIDGRPAPRISSAVTFSIAMESIGPGTRVVLESTNVPSGPFAAIVLRLVAARRIRKSLDRALDIIAAAGG
jgi:uncharacterized protein YndB with AHSA1/START domain